MSYIKVKRCSTYTHFKREYKSKTCISPLSYRIVPAQSLSFSFSLSTHSLYTHSFRLFRLSLSLFPYSFFLSLALFSHFPLFLSHCTHPFQSPSYPTLSTIPPLFLNISLPYTFTSYLTYPLSLSFHFLSYDFLSFSQKFHSLNPIFHSQSLSLKLSLSLPFSLSPQLCLSFPLSHPTTSYSLSSISILFPFFHPTLSLQLQPHSLLLQLHLSPSQSLISTLSFIIVSLSHSLFTLTFI